MLPVINTSVLGRTFPEWKGEGKENTQPSSPAINNDTASLFGPDSPRLRTRHQAPEVEDTMDFELPPQPSRGNLTTLLDTLKTARSEKTQPSEEPAKRSSQVSPRSELNARFSANATRRVSRQSNVNNHDLANQSVVNQTAHSFFVPNVTHLNDFVSGTLRWSSVRNGTPVFVKHGKVHDRDTKTSMDHHADFEAVSLPREEDEIFVSLDKIREEIQALQEHDELVSKQAEHLQDEVCELQSHVARLNSRKDSAMGSDADGSIIVQLTTQNTQLEEQISSLKARLDQANRKISLNEIHNQSFVAERDEALQRASDHVTTIKRLQTRNDTITQQKLELQQTLTEAEEELNSERVMLDNLHQKYEMVSEEKSLLKEDNLGLERHNEELFKNNKLLQQQNAQVERENHNLRDKIDQLQELVDVLNKKLSRKSETRYYTQESKGSMSNLSKSKHTNTTQIRESGETHATRSEPVQAASSQKHASKQDDGTRDDDHTRNPHRRYAEEIEDFIPAMGKSKPSKMTQAREAGDRYTMMSEMSAKTTTSNTDMQMQDDYTQQIDLTREAQVDSDQENMTSALFIDDITMDSNNNKFTHKQKTRGTPAVRVLSPILSVAESASDTEDEVTGKQKETTTPPVLTQSAKRVLNNLCQDHECYNCTVCTRIRAHRHESDGSYGKKTVRVERPVPVTDRVERRSSTLTHDCEDQATMRPSQDPALALAKVMKGLKDEEKHIRAAIARKQAVYDECDAAVNKKMWKKLDAEIRVLRKRRDLKRDQIYDLHDVLEGQKANAQLMSQEAVDMTINSVLSKDPTWNGVLDY